MRRFTSLISDSFVRREQPTSPPAATIHERINRVLRRRLSDRVADVFQEACMTWDLDAAEELLAVLEAMHARRQAALGERRIGDEDLVRAREQLAARKAAAAKSGEVA